MASSTSLGNDTRDDLIMSARSTAARTLIGEIAGPDLIERAMAGPSAPGLSERVKRFERCMHPALYGLSRRHPRVQDLLTSFPAAAIALATLRGEPAARGEALGRIAAGRPLVEIAEALDLSYWLRRFAPEQLGDTIPDCFTFAGPAHGFNASIARRVPSKPEAAALWLTRLAQMLDYGPPDTALWAATPSRQGLIYRANLDRILPLYGFYSARPESLAGQMIQLRLADRDSMRRVASAMANWMTAIIFDHALDFTGCPDVLVLPSRFGEASIRPLLDPRHLYAEARAMNNCLDRYMPQALLGRSLLFRMDLESGERIVFEILPCPATLHQVRGPSNCPPSREAEGLVKHWFEDVFRPIATPLPPRLQVDPEIWHLFWEAYWQVHGPHGAVPVEPTHIDLVRLCLLMAY